MRLSLDESADSNSFMIHSSVFDSFGILETILSYVEARDLLQATMVNRRWKMAGRADSLWKFHIEELWNGKVGFAHLREQAQKDCAMDGSGKEDDTTTTKPLIFWRSLFTAECVQKMTRSHIISVFDHPLLNYQLPQLQQVANDDTQLKNFYKMHMLDIMSGSSQLCCFHSDVYFGSYASSLQDAQRDVITNLELCNPLGFDMYFKIARDDVDEVDQLEFTAYEESEEILLYEYGAGLFHNSYDFRMTLRQDVLSHHPTGMIPQQNRALLHISNSLLIPRVPSELAWQWLDNGRKLQVASYPPLTVSRTKRWGWKLENIHAILLMRNTAP
ncbi:MAG: hypothetical protein SGBAC_009008 [Bacillariaceae sp.]